MRKRLLALLFAPICRRSTDSAPYSLARNHHRSRNVLVRANFPIIRRIQAVIPTQFKFLVSVFEGGFEMLRMSKLVVFSALAAVCVLCLGTGEAALAGQTSATQGTVTVVVLDTTGGVIQDAQLELRDLSTNDIRKATTQGEGTYSFVNLPIGIYRLA